MNMRNIIAAASVAAAALTSPFAMAHANLQTSSPEAGAMLAIAPREITLTFNEKIEEAFSKVTLADEQGKEVSTEKVAVDAANPAVLHLPVTGLRAGTYTVNWAVAGRDGHRCKGNFQFSVK